MFTQFQNYIQKNVGTAATTVVTCPANQQLLINQISCSNTTINNVTCSVTVVRGSTTIFIVRNATIPGGGSLTCAGREQKVVIMAGDVLQVQSSAASSIDVIVSGVLNDFNRNASVPAPVEGTVQTFLITPDRLTVSEFSTFGTTITYTVNTTNVPNGTVMFWENIGTTTGDDFTDGLNEGTVTINFNSANITRTLRNTDVQGEDTKTVVLILRTVPRFSGGGALASSRPVTVFDSGVTNGLIMYLDAGLTESYNPTSQTWFDVSGNENHVTLQNSPGYSGDAFFFNGTNQWARTAQNLNLTAFNAVTVEILVRTNTTTGCFMSWEHTPDWNTNTGGMGLSLHCTGIGGQANQHHTNHNTGPARNYNSNVGTGWALHTNVFSRINDSTGRLSYVNGELVPFVTGPGYPTGTATSGGSFANNILYFAGRGGAGQMPGQIMMFRIYNRKLSEIEIQRNYTAIRNRILGPFPEVRGGLLTYDYQVPVGSTTVIPSSGLLNNALTLTSSAISTTRKPKVDATSLFVNGSGSATTARAEVTGLAIASTTFTWESWVFYPSFTTSGTSPVLFSVGNDSGNLLAVRWIAANLIEFRTNIGNASQAQGGNVGATTQPQSGVWQHHAITADGTNYRYYLDGILVGQTTNNNGTWGFVGTSGRQINGYTIGNWLGAPFTGTWSNAYFWNTRLTQGVVYNANFSVVKSGMF